MKKLVGLIVIIITLSSCYTSAHGYRGRHYKKQCTKASRIKAKRYRTWY